MANFRGRARVSRRAGETLAGDVGVYLGDGISETARQLIEGAYPRVGAAVVRRLQNMEKSVRSRWPVKTGTSRDSIALETRATADTLTVALVVRAWYAGFIRGKGFRAGPGQDLILGPADALADDLQGRVADEVSR